MRLLAVHFINEIVLVLKVIHIVCIANPCNGEEGLESQISALSENLVHVSCASGFIIKISFKLVSIKLPRSIIGIYTFIFENIVPSIVIVKTKE